MPELQQALWWFYRGYNVVPQKAVDRKHPGVHWKALQRRKVTPAELTAWAPRFVHGVGFITGEISGVIVVETDGPAGDALIAHFERLHGTLPPTLTIRSGSGRGLHRHFKHPGFRIPTRANPTIKIDVKGDGGFCVLPPSIHKSGGSYDIVLDTEPAPLPPLLLLYIEAAARSGAGGSALKVTDPGLPPQPFPRGSYQSPNTPRQRARLIAALRHVSADCGYDRYRNVVWALLDTGWDDAKTIAHAWCMTAPARFEEVSFSEIVADYNAGLFNRPTLGTIFHLAREGGWHE